MAFLSFPSTDIVLSVFPFTFSGSNIRENIPRAAFAKASSRFFPKACIFASAVCSRNLNLSILICYHRRYILRIIPAVKVYHLCFSWIISLLVIIEDVEQARVRCWLAAVRRPRAEHIQWSIDVAFNPRLEHPDNSLDVLCAVLFC